MIYVYKHTFPNGKVYIGITKNIEKRWEKNGTGYKTQRVYRAIQKYGWENVTHEILVTCDTEEKAKLYEMYYIQKYDSYKNGYNSTLGGEFMQKSYFSPLLSNQVRMWKKFGWFDVRANPMTYVAHEYVFKFLEECEKNPMKAALANVVAETAIPLFEELCKPLKPFSRKYLNDMRDIIYCAYFLKAFETILLYNQIVPCVHGVYQESDEFDM